MLLTILGAIPYFAMGILMSTMGYNWSTWQLWTMVGIMIVSDTISFLKAKTW